MLRLSLVFLVWIASTATFVESSEEELQESTELAWLEGDARHKAVLESAARDWYHYRKVDEYERSYYYARR
jgi:hypothetical protein